jgi:hypothetical protein
LGSDGHRLISLSGSFIGGTRKRRIVPNVGSLTQCLTTAIRHGSAEQAGDCRWRGIDASAGGSEPVQRHLTGGVPGPCWT